jgi:hypothetical protein
VDNFAVERHSIKLQNEMMEMLDSKVVRNIYLPALSLWKNKASAV